VKKKVIMKLKGKELIAEIPYEHVKFKYVSNHYDMHLNGTCIYDGEICEFVNPYPDYSEELDDLVYENVKIYRLGIAEKIKWIWKQWLFEQCVGYNWTYGKSKKGQELTKRGEWFTRSKPDWLKKVLYKWYYSRKKYKKNNSNETTKEIKKENH